MADDSMAKKGSMPKSQGTSLERQDTILTIGKLKLRGQTDDLPQ